MAGRRPRGTPAPASRRSTPRDTLTPGAGWASASRCCGSACSCSSRSPRSWRPRPRRLDRYFSVLDRRRGPGRGQADRAQSRCCVTLINIVMGTIIASVLVRDSFGQGRPERRHGRAVRPATIVAASSCCLSTGRTARSASTGRSATRRELALAFVTLPSSSGRAARARELEARRRGAAASLGASRSRSCAGSSCPAWRRRSRPAPRSPSRVPSRSTAPWCCCRATGPFQDRGRLGAGADLHRERQQRLGRRARVGDAVLALVMIVTLDIVQRRVSRRR